jgi:tRNA modification GTPase
VVLSVAERRGLDTLERAVLGHLQGRPSAEAETPLVSHRRHVTALRHAMNYLATAAEGLQSGFSPEFIVVDLTAAIGQIDDLTGRNTLDEDVLDQIFSRFCLGKYGGSLPTGSRARGPWDHRLVGESESGA